MPKLRAVAKQGRTLVQQAVAADFIDDNDARLQAIFAEVEARLGDDEGMVMARQAAAVLKANRKGLPTDADVRDTGAYLECLWRLRLRSPLQALGAYQYSRAAKNCSYVERGAKRPLFAGQQGAAAAAAAGMPWEWEGLLQRINSPSEQAEEAASMAGDVPAVERSRLLLQHAHVATHVRPHGFASVGKVQASGPLGLLLLHGLQLQLAVTFDASFRRQIHTRLGGSACTFSPAVELERLGALYGSSPAAMRSIPPPPAGAQVPMFDHLSVHSQLLFVTQVVEGLLCENVPLPPDHALCFAAFNKLLLLGLLAPLEEATAAGAPRGGQVAAAAAAADNRHIAAARQAESHRAAADMQAAVAQLRVVLHEALQQQQQHIAPAALQLLAAAGCPKQQQQQEIQQLLQQRSDLTVLCSDNSNHSSSSSSSRQQQVWLQTCLAIAWPVTIKPSLLVAMTSAKETQQQEEAKGREQAAAAALQQQQRGAAQLVEAAVQGAAQIAAQQQQQQLMTEDQLLHQLLQLLVQQNKPPESDSQPTGSSSSTSPPGPAAAAAAVPGVPGLEFQGYVNLACNVLLQRVLAAAPPAGGDCPTAWSWDTMLLLLELLLDTEKLKSQAAGYAAVALIEAEGAADASEQQQQQQQQQEGESIDDVESRKGRQVADDGGSTSQSCSETQQQQQQQQQQHGDDGDDSSSTTFLQHSCKVDENCSMLQQLCTWLAGVRSFKQQLAAGGAPAAAAAAAATAYRSHQKQQQQQQGPQQLNHKVKQIEQQQKQQEQQQQQQQDGWPAGGPCDDASCVAAAAAAAEGMSYWRQQVLLLYRRQRPEGWKWLQHNFENVDSSNHQPGWWGLVRYFLAADVLNLRHRLSPLLCAAVKVSWCGMADSAAAAAAAEEGEGGLKPVAAASRQCARMADKALAMKHVSGGGAPIQLAAMQQLLRLACMAAAAPGMLAYCNMKAVAHKAAAQTQQQQQQQRRSSSSSSKLRASRTCSANLGPSAVYPDPDLHLCSDENVQGSAVSSVDAILQADVAQLSKQEAAAAAAAAAASTTAAGVETHDCFPDPDISALDGLNLNPDQLFVDAQVRDSPVARSSSSSSSSSDDDFRSPIQESCTASPPASAVSDDDDDNKNGKDGSSSAAAAAAANTEGGSSEQGLGAAAAAAAAQQWDGSTCHLSLCSMLGPLFAADQQGPCLARLMQLLVQYHQDTNRAMQQLQGVLDKELQQLCGSKYSSSSSSTANSSSSRYQAAEAAVSDTPDGSRLLVLLMGLYHLSMRKEQQQRQEQQAWQQQHKAPGTSSSSGSVYAELHIKLVCCNTAAEMAEGMLDLLYYCTLLPDVAAALSSCGNSTSNSSSSKHVCSIAAVLVHDSAGLLRLLQSDLETANSMQQADRHLDTTPASSAAGSALLGFTPAADAAGFSAASEVVDCEPACDWCSSSSSMTPVRVCSDCGVALLCSKCSKTTEAATQHRTSQCNELQKLFSAAVTSSLQAPWCRCDNCMKHTNQHVLLSSVRPYLSPQQLLLAPWQQQQQQQQQLLPITVLPDRSQASLVREYAAGPVRRYAAVRQQQLQQLQREWMLLTTNLASNAHWAYGVEQQLRRQEAQQQAEKQQQQQQQKSRGSSSSNPFVSAAAAAFNGISSVWGSGASSSSSSSSAKGSSSRPAGLGDSWRCGRQQQQQHGGAYGAYGASPFMGVGLDDNVLFGKGADRQQQDYQDFLDELD